MSAVVFGGGPRSDSENWCGKLDVTLAHFAGRTRVVRSEHLGPLRIQRPFYPEEDGTCHLYLLHPPGGVVGGDQLDVSLSLEREAHAVVTQPSATKLYRSAGRECRLTQRLRVDEGCLLEWLPQETIAFDGSRTRTQTRVDIAQGAQFIGWEVVCLGRPAAGEGFERGRLCSRLELWKDDEPLYMDRLNLAEDLPTQRALWGLAGDCVYGTMLLSGAEEGVSQIIRQLAFLSDRRHRLAVTDLDQVTVVRYVGSSLVACWEAFVSIWRTVRPVISGTSASVPRIWSC